MTEMATSQNVQSQNVQSQKFAVNNYLPLYTKTYSDAHNIPLDISTAYLYNPFIKKIHTDLSQLTDNIVVSLSDTNISSHIENSARKKGFYILYKTTNISNISHAPFYLNPISNSVMENPPNLINSCDTCNDEYNPFLWDTKYIGTTYLSNNTIQFV